MGEAMKTTPLGASCLHWLTLYARKHHFFSSPKDCVRLINARMQCWIHSVHSLGINLVEYGAREAPNLRKYFRLYANTWWNGGQTFTLSFGPQPKDWHLSLWNPCETYARHFWLLVAGEPVLDHMARIILTRERAMNKASIEDADMPGRWVDDGLDIEQLKDSLMNTGDHVLDSMESDLLDFSDEAFFRKYKVYKSGCVIEFLRLWCTKYTGRGVSLKSWMRRCEVKKQTITPELSSSSRKIPASKPPESTESPSCPPPKIRRPVLFRQQRHSLDRH